MEYVVFFNATTSEDHTDTEGASAYVVKRKDSPFIDFENGESDSLVEAKEIAGELIDLWFREYHLDRSNYTIWVRDAARGGTRHEKILYEILVHEL